MIATIFLIIIFVYAVQTLTFIVGSRRKFPRIKEEKLPTVTVIVAARNEEKNILRCLQSLDKLEYPEGKLEIIIVDDNSTDKTGELIENFISGKSRFKKIVSKKEIGMLKGKTNALANALEIAKGEIILTTDADCAVNPLWVKTNASYFQPDVAIVDGYTTQVANNGFGGMQAIDFIYLQTVGAGTINIGMPISCIGNNMSYRKKAYLEVGGYENLPFSVTEDFQLLNAIKMLKKYKIIFPVNHNSLVTSLPCNNLKELYRQKKRWSVGGLGVPLVGYLVMVFGFLANLFILLTPFFFSPVWLYLVLIKIIFDYFLVYNSHKLLHITKGIKYFLHFEIYYIIYVVMIPFVLTFFGRRVVWKGRKF
jgi:cellulose synthase/poly-beta-1,6-N-acetylglucosamine synthase-like glycosyltransferase